MVFSKKMCPKQQPAYLLCVVLKRLNDVNYLIRLEGGGGAISVSFITTN